MEGKNLKTTFALHEAIKRFPFILPFVFALAACSNTQAGGGPRAEQIFTTAPGHSCFLIRDDEGKGVGGGCVKDE